MCVKNRCVAIFKLTILNQFGERLWERLEINQQLLILFEYVEILFTANHLVEEKWILFISDINNECLTVLLRNKL